MEIVGPQYTLAQIRTQKSNSFSKEAVGTLTADFLNLFVGARAPAMAGAYSAVSEEASAIYYNPAGLVQIPKLSAIFMQARYVADINFQYAAYGHRLSPDSVIGVSAFLTDIGTIERTKVGGEKSGTFTPRDQVFTLSYSKAILEFSDKDKDVSMGISAKYINSKILNNARSFAVDFGVMTYNFTAIPYRIGAVMSNFGKGLKYDTQSDSLPLTIKLAGSVYPFRNLMVSADVVLPKNNNVNFLFGTELTAEPNELTKLSLRAGVNSRMMKDNLDGFTIGTGVTLHFFTIDYAFTPMGDLGDTHRISLTFDFPYRNPVFQRRDRSIFTKIKSISFK